MQFVSFQVTFYFPNSLLLCIYFNMNGILDSGLANRRLPYIFTIFSQKMHLKFLLTRLCRCHQGCNRKFFLRGQSHFSFFLIFFPVWNAFSWWKISILFDSKQISVVFKSEKQKKKKKILYSFCNFFLLTISIFHLPRFNFPSFFPIFLFFFASFFGRSAEISLSDVSGGGNSAPWVLCFWVSFNTVLLWLLKVLFG